MMTSPLLSDRGLRVAEHYLVGPDTYTGVRPKRRVRSDTDFNYAVYKTGRAITAGATIAAMDGPVPILDAVGFGVAVAGSIAAWHEYFTRSA